ncbi:UDP-N-acetyl-D-galactosamine dehydrogenase [Caldimicrobium thiodismutans]|uniref:UDP-N-acetyl-D-galactosamine dehydrogenase n=1 Tax=Caldimicrobium thiodismutans TaxID=1653476 RepID=A0A0U5AI39_9BACT|nr:nucleotide sugar dehydrogenase [Caldimicrobium thiodismutans]BAU23559.1 UDP-N-acetyl-D-galactosamine dehydrogenase [Caldimicrobium thiodismutans]
MINFDDLKAGKEKICVVGLGYVGLPLAFYLSKSFKVVGFDINTKRIEELKSGIDSTGEITKEVLSKCKLELSSDASVLKECRVIIIAVPTPVDKLKNPDLSFLKSASKLVGENLTPGSVVVYESTVYPGTTEEVCIPILEQASGLKWKKDFFVGYSPERVNPGDKEHTIDKIVKVVAGDTEKTAELLERIYGSITKVFRARDIKTAEAAKVIENIQRDLNIALMNEFALIFHKLGLDTKEVLETASTKWNFLRFEPGLVGGHCIPVDPYYLAYKSLELGYVPELILAGRSINEYMTIYISHQVVKQLIKAGKQVKDAKVLVLGITFKENVPDVRNSKVVDMIKELTDYGISVFAYDPLARKEEVKAEYGIELIEDYKVFAPYDAIILAVRHKIFLDFFNLETLLSLSSNPPILFDIKGVFDKEEALSKGFIYWRL